jgi:carboxyl-terminal processing protease
MKKLLIIFSLTAILFSSCKKEVPPSDTYTITEQARDQLYLLMKDWYLWYNRMPAVTLENYKDPYELMRAVRFDSLDRWSFVADYDAYVANMMGTFVGHGISVGLDAEGKARIVTIYKNSPLYSTLTNPNGVRRGWEIKSLNGQDLAAVMAAMYATGDRTAYNNLMGPSVTTRSNTFVFRTPRGNDTTATSKKASFQVNSVMLYDTLTINGKKTGHLVFDEFIEPSTDELKTAFAFFKAQDIKDLILDLRYNSGGILDVAIELSSLIAGKSTSTPLVSSKYNNKNTSEESTRNFVSMVSSLSLTRLVVITTRSTASASEVIINGLKPYLEVTTIGDTTNGKPTGMDVYQFAETFIFAPITFKLVNANGEGDFYAGFAPAKFVPDDITHDFRDKNELCFKEAIYFLQNGHVTTKGGYIYTPSIHYSEKPSLINNTYNIDKLTNPRK